MLFRSARCGGAASGPLRERLLEKGDDAAPRCRVPTAQPGVQNEGCFRQCREQRVVTLAPWTSWVVTLGCWPSRLKMVLSRARLKPSAGGVSRPTSHLLKWPEERLDAPLGEAPEEAQDGVIAREAHAAEHGMER